MNTSILTVVLTSALLAGQNGTPTWQNDYSQARQQGVAQKKPLLVVFGSGANGWAKVVRETPNADLTKLMAEKYICVYIDTATPDGKQLAQEFGVAGNVGFVISDRACTSQAFWHQGDMANLSVAAYLAKYADPNVSVRGTETISTGTRTSFYPSSSEVNWEAGVMGGSSYCPSCNNVRSRR
jgi:hypothetical protein